MLRSIDCCSYPEEPQGLAGGVEGAGTGTVGSAVPAQAPGHTGDL